MVQEPQLQQLATAEQEQEADVFLMTVLVILAVLSCKKVVFVDFGADEVLLLLNVLVPILEVIFCRF